MNQLMPIFESLRQKEDLPCSYPLHMHAPSYHWVNNIILLIDSLDIYMVGHCHVIYILLYLYLFLHSYIYYFCLHFLHFKTLINIIELLLVA